MSTQNSDEEIADRTATMHVVKFAFPELHLAPWGSVHDKKTITMLAGAWTIADMSDDLNRRKWLDDQAKTLPEIEKAKTWAEVGTIWLEKNPGKELPAFMKPKPKPQGDEEEEEEDEFDKDIVRGGPAMVGVFLRSLAQHTHDLAPSVDGLRTRQAIGLGGAVKSNIAIQPPQKRSWKDKLTGRNKSAEQVSSGG